MCTSSVPKIFLSIKNGTLLEELNNFDNESLKLFLPVLTLSSFPSSSLAVSTKYVSLYFLLIFLF